MQQHKRLIHQQNQLLGWNIWFASPQRPYSTHRYYFYFTVQAVMSKICSLLQAGFPMNGLVISARAPYMVSEGHYKWYDVKMVDNKITIDISQEEESRKAVLKFMDEIISFYHADRNRIVLAGFSQGANMASVVSLTSPEKVIGFAIFSGRFMEEIKPLISTSASLRSVQCFLAHGNRDNMLPIAYARENQQKIQLLGISVTFSEDASAHTISQKQYKDFLHWLKQF